MFLESIRPIRYLAIQRFPEGTDFMSQPFRYPAFAQSELVVVHTTFRGLVTVPGLWSAMSTGAPVARKGH